MKKFSTPFFIALLLLLSQTVLAQKEADYWYFGWRAGIHFNGTATPNTLVNSAMDNVEGCSTISDTSGNLLFYTNGIVIWDANHDTMPNSRFLNGDISSSQSALIVPQPGGTGMYYVFTTDADNESQGFQYSIVDMSLNGGLGDVTATKNVKLFANSTEKISAVRHPGNGVWVMAHTYGNNSFYAYDLTAAGLNTTPVISSVGTVHQAVPFQNSYGQMKFSPGAKKIVVAIGNQGMFELFDFDNKTGQVSNPIPLPVNSGERVFGVEFSPDGSKLYTTHYSVDQAFLDQYDISSGDALLIEASRTNLNTQFEGGGIFYSLQVANNGKIYIAMPQPTDAYLSVINNPNAAGVNCDFVLNGVLIDSAFSGLVFIRIGLPGFVQSYFQSPPVANFVANDTTICQGSCISFTDKSTGEPYAWKWYFDGALVATSDSASPQQVCYNLGGLHTVKLVVWNDAGADSLVKNQYINVSQSNGGGSLFTARNPICEGTLARIVLTGNAGTYQWQSSNDAQAFTDITGEDDNTYTFIANDEKYYRVSVTGGNCPGFSDTLHLMLIPTPVADYSYTSNGLTITFNSDNSQGADSYEWDFGDSTALSSTANPEHTFAEKKVYQVCLVVKNISNCFYTLCKNIDLRTTGTEDLEAYNIHLYPVPFTNELYLDALPDNTQQVEIFDVLGKSVLLKEIDYNNANTSLDVSTLSKGVYLLKVKTTTGEYQAKAVKQ